MTTHRLYCYTCASPKLFDETRMLIINISDWMSDMYAQDGWKINSFTLNELSVSLLRNTKVLFHQKFRTLIGIS